MLPSTLSTHETTMDELTFTDLNVPVCDVLRSVMVATWASKIILVGRRLIFAFLLKVSPLDIVVDNIAEAWCRVIGCASSSTDPGAPHDIPNKGGHVKPYVIRYLTPR